ncbi:ABC-three component system middle component 1 [Paraclostridium sordellii]|uniref:ABC-three component system middle component 1 n=1 Tax=Paraclostridium sordellii TaxID=1505 RepID=UPI0005DA7812|nr:ABC-three component system middle component 1 [Paeniclostridium sordellii]CEO08436.1 Uncharacterised protein [[Clostridium] sordellii] [Paeniclostridium sordellii]CEP87209.1 Uncharacterised protein [[Clostridium] sordellii] [Paeniclostridium sordellii]
MKQIINKIFTNNNFTIKELNKSSYYSSNEKSENYIVYFLDDLIESNIENILSNNIYDSEIDFMNKEMKSNTSVIFIVKVKDSNLDDREKKSIFKIEEDPYFYKKYVLWYTEEEILNINNFIDTNNIANSIMNKKMFTLMKEIMEEPIKANKKKYKKISVADIKSYMLLCRLFIKLPFLTLKSIYDTTDGSEIDKFEKSILDIFAKYEDISKELENDFIDLDIDLSEKDYNMYLEEVEKEIKIF